MISISFGADIRKLIFTNELMSKNDSIIRGNETETLQKINEQKRFQFLLEQVS
jgi:hypothetical protein